MVVLDDSHIAIAEEKLQMDFTEFRELTHIIVGSSNKNGAIGLELHKDMVWITFLYSDNKLDTNKNLVGIMKWAYEFYTEKQHLPIMYTGITNLFPHNSIEVSDKVWQYIPRRSLRNML
jgi:hypothetical protein